MYHSDDVRQLAWDSLLIKGWDKDSRMGSLMDMYVIDHPDEELWLLRRFPRKWELTLTARVFIARFIPKLSQKLWDNPKDVLFWLMMNGDSVKRQKTVFDNIRNKKDINEIKKSIRLDEKNKRFVVERDELYKKHRASSQWDICK